MESYELVTGIVLAGGKSIRMGQNKAELRLGGKSFLHIQVDKLKALGVGEILISGASLIDEENDLQVIPDIYPERGPLGGLHAGLLAARNSCALVVTVDMPLLPETALRSIILQHKVGNADVTVLDVAGKSQPLVAVYEKRLSTKINALIRGGSCAVRRLMDELTVQSVPYVGDPYGVLNCNTPEEYERMVSLFEAQ